MSKRLWLMRHGEACLHQGKDIDRPLHNRAKKQFEKVQQELNPEQFFPKKVFVSPALRTVQTFEWWNKALGGTLTKIIVDELYLATSAQIQQILWKELSNSGEEEVMVIGHNPGISDFIDKSLASSSINFLGLPTAGLAVLDYTMLQDWKEMLPYQAKLLKLIYP